MTDKDYEKNRTVVIDGIEYTMADEDIEAERQMDEKERFFNEHPELIPDDMRAGVEWEDLDWS